MKGWTKGLLALVVVLVALASLVWFLPARWAAPRVQAQLHGLQLHEVGGSIWDGHADRLVGADGTVLGRVHWQLSRRALLGRVQLAFQFSGPFAEASGKLAREGGEVQWRDVDLDLHLDSMPPSRIPSLGVPRGTLQVHIARATVRAGWPMALHATARWQQAAMRLGRGDIALGELTLEADGNHGVIQGYLHDGGQGPLSAKGTLQLSPLGWRLEADLRPRDDDPVLREWLARLGPADAQGHVHIQRGAGIGAVPAAGVSP